MQGRVRLTSPPAARDCGDQADAECRSCGGARRRAGALAYRTVDADATPAPSRGRIVALYFIFKKYNIKRSSTFKIFANIFDGQRTEVFCTTQFSGNAVEFSNSICASL
jgi:hypothetical protein